MIVNNLNVNEMRPQQPIATDTDAAQTVNVFLSNVDTQALKFVLTYYREMSYHSTIMRLIGERDQVEELTISKASRHMNKAEIKMDQELITQLSSESDRLGIGLGEYLRAIVYSRGSQLQHEKRIRYDAIGEQHRKRETIRCEIPINYELKKKYYDQYGDISNKEIAKIVREKVMEFLQQ